MYYDYRCYENENDLVTTQLYDLAQFTAIELIGVSIFRVPAYHLMLKLKWSLILLFPD